MLQQLKCFSGTIVYIVAGLVFLLMNSCTYSITMVHTEGTATDVVDETASATPSTSVSIPVSATGMPSLSSLLPVTSTTVK